VVPAGDPEPLGDAIASLAADAARRAAMGERARAHVRAGYSVARLVEDIDKLYSELLVTRPARAR
jgi:glycosyltransferase involved in cell wall biosynthesis